MFDFTADGATDGAYLFARYPKPANYDSSQIVMDVQMSVVCGETIEDPSACILRIGGGFYNHSDISMDGKTNISEFGTLSDHDDQTAAGMGVDSWTIGTRYTIEFTHTGDESDAMDLFEALFDATADSYFVLIFESLEGGIAKYYCYDVSNSNPTLYPKILLYMTLPTYYPYFVEFRSLGPVRQNPRSGKWNEVVESEWGWAL